ncbi:MAG: hypothetical protein ACK4MR_10955, partial [Erythrobacter cryptus]
MDIGFQFELAWRRLVVTAIGIALTLVLWLLLRLFDNRALWIKISAAIVLALPVALAIGQVNYWVFKDMSPAIERALLAAVKRHGWNVAASRLTTGNHPIYARLERKLARFFGAEAALLLPTGYVAPL